MKTKYMWMILALLACLAVFVFPSKQLAKQMPAAAQPDSTMRVFSLSTSWPLPMRAIPTGVPDRPKLPPPPPVPQLLFGHWLEPDLRPVLTQTLTTRTDWLFDHYPIDWLRQEFAVLRSTEQLHVDFKLVSRKGAAFNATTSPRNGGSAYLTLYVGGLLGAKVDEDFFEIFLSMHHEFIHYRRWLSVTLKEEAAVDEPTQHLADYCQFKWEDERDAMLQTCPLNIQWGLVADTHATCLYSDVAKDFDHAYFTLILMQRERIGLDAMPGARQCLGKWAKIAGHPNPDEFKN